MKIYKLEINNCSKTVDVDIDIISLTPEGPFFGPCNQFVIHPLNESEYLTYIGNKQITSIREYVPDKNIYALKSKRYEYTLINELGKEREVNENTLVQYITDKKIIIERIIYRIKAITEIVNVTISDAKD